MRRALPWALVFAVLAGCSSRYATLKDETDAALFDKNDEHACLCHEFGECHVTTHHVLTHGPSGVDCRVAVHELGPGDGAPVVLIHGVFADHSSWRFVAPLLARSRHVFVVDLPGCGESDAPEATPETEADLYSPRAMARRVGDALTDVLAATDPKPITVVAHSLGGFVTLRMLDAPDFRRRFDALDARIDRLVLIAPLDGIIEKADPAFVAVASLTGLDVALGSALGIMQEKVTDVVLKSVSEQSDALRAEADKRMEILKDGPRRRAMQSMLRQAVPIKPGVGDFEPDWDRMLADAVQVRNIKKPTLILWGERDEVMPVAMGYRLRANMPDAELRVFPLCRHSPQIEEPAACATIIDDFMSASAATAITRTDGPAVDIDVRRVARLLPRSPVRPDATPQPVEGGR